MQIEGRNINRLCIDICLSNRITPGRWTLPGKPWVFGGQGSRLSNSLLIPTFSLRSAPPNLTIQLRRTTNAPLPRRAKRDNADYCRSNADLADIYIRVYLRAIRIYPRCCASHSIHSFGNLLSPVEFSAQQTLTSELLHYL